MTEKCLEFQSKNPLSIRNWVNNPLLILGIREITFGSEPVFLGEGRNWRLHGRRGKHPT